MIIDKRKFFIQFFAILGLALSIELALIYYNANYKAYSLSSFCSISEFVDCDGAAKTTVAQFLGIPLAYWGMFFYITVLFLTFVDKLKKIKFLKFLDVFKNPLEYITVLGSFAFFVSMVLAGFSIFVIKKLCILCVVTYFIDLLIAFIAARGIKEYFISYKTTILDFIDGVKKYPKTFVVLLIAAISFLTFSGITNTFVPHIKKSKEIRKYFSMKVNPYKVNGNLLGAEDGDVVIELYSDYVCPMCYVHNIMLHRAVKEYKNIKVIHHNMPFDNICNRNLRVNMHPGACYLAKAAIAAGKQGNYWGMSSLLYENKPMNPEQLEALVNQLGFDKEQFFKDVYSEDTEKELAESIKESEDLGLDSTPTMFVNGDKYIGLMQYDDLKDILVKHGAKRK